MSGANLDEDGAEVGLSVGHLHRWLRGPNPVLQFFNIVKEPGGPGVR